MHAWLISLATGDWRLDFIWHCVIFLLGGDWLLNFSGMNHLSILIFSYFSNRPLFWRLPTSDWTLSGAVLYFYWVATGDWTLSRINYLLLLLFSYYSNSALFLTTGDWWLNFFWHCIIFPQGGYCRLNFHTYLGKSLKSAKLQKCLAVTLVTWQRWVLCRFYSYIRDYTVGP